ncbi:SDR family NAD(P)-dependent oxidoreductase [Streptomyces melanosporofaciens]|uniref:NAD(P)-dependent dehydrogenase, short-chain alcohol dehydrogenase family n=1 Tax=Streptomyces melanosporofaciens TaxID=67327 RepID=A0A1H4KKD3_STRMJ|nr:SDR family oxidoreductase [Streptomyces melanosporofaciens]SEB58696.1 NAD(P)-dependent dehydrogenase, short-chain alcohol dehydrogenase family [Streptomyces melanosporofaciens]
MTNLNDAVVVVTGGATGVGLALVREAVRRGARVMIVDVTDAGETVAALRREGAIVESTIADVCDAADVQRGVTETVEHFGGVNVVCNNAGTAALGRLQEVEPEAAHRVLRVNVEGAFHVIHAFAPALHKAAAAGHPAYLLNTGSEHSLGVPPHVEPISIYTASKYAVLGLTMTAHRDLGPSGIGVSMLAPGWTLTEKVRARVHSDPKTAAAIMPYAQEPAEVASRAFDGLLAGTRVIATNPHSRAFAMEHARNLMIDIQELPIVDAPDGHAHDTPADVSACPVAGMQ